MSTSRIVIVSGLLVTATAVSASFGVSASGAAATVLGIGAGLAIGAMGVACVGFFGYAIWKFLCSSKQRNH